MFAPVGDTHLLVIIQTWEQEALAAIEFLKDHIARWSLPLALGIGLVWISVWAVRSRSLGQRTSP